MTSAPAGPTKPAVGVTVASPAITPVTVPRAFGLPSSHHSQQEPGQPARGGGYVGHRNRHRGVRVRRDRAASVEAQPPHPQHRGSRHRERHAVRRWQASGEARPRSHHYRHHEGRGARGGVHDDAARVVQDSEVTEPTAAPNPVSDGSVDQQRPQGGEQQHRRKAHALDESADDQRGSDDGECDLERREHGLRNGVPQRALADADVEGSVQSPDEAETVAIRQAVADDDPQDGYEARNRETLQHQGHHGARSNHAAIEERQARDRHEQHQHRRCRHPGGVAAAKRLAECIHRAERQSGDHHGANETLMVEFRAHTLSSPFVERSGSASPRCDQPAAAPDSSSRFLTINWTTAKTSPSPVPAGGSGRASRTSSIPRCSLMRAISASSRLIIS